MAASLCVLVAGTLVGGGCVEKTGTDLYECLGAARDSSGKELKRAFRGMVRICHPDLNPDDPGAAERLRQAIAAYETLGDPVSRARYDRIENLFGPRRRPREEVIDEKQFLWLQMPAPRWNRMACVQARKAQAGKQAVVCLLLACLVGVLVALATTVSPARWIASPRDGGNWPKTANVSASTARYSQTAESWFVQNAEAVEPGRP